MSTDTNSDNTDTDYSDILQVSDDDFLNMPEPDFDNMDSDPGSTSGDDDEEDSTEATNASEGGEQTDQSETEGNASTEDDETQDGEDNQDPSEDDGSSSDEAANVEGDDADNAASNESANASDSADTTVGDDSEGDVDTSTSDKTIDYESEYARLTSTFKANGRDMNVDNVDEAIKLMQMGANYQKKMASVAPNLKYLKMLENNKLLDESTLNHLIDLHKGDVSAIKELIQLHKVDIDNVDFEDSSTPYKATSYNVSDSEMALDEVLQDIGDTSSFTKTMNIINDTLDVASKDTLANNPEAIRTLNDHVELGFYSQIQNQVAKQRLLGDLRGLSDIEAYRQVGDGMSQAGLLVAPAGTGNNSSTNLNPSRRSPANSNAQPTAASKVRKQRRKAASSTTQRNSSKRSKKKEFDVLNMSDADFEKLGEDFLN